MTPAEKVAREKKVKPNPVRWGERRKAKRPVVYTTKLVGTRTTLGLTIDEVSKASGVSNNAVCDAECGFEVMLTTALKLARFYGLPVEQLWEPVKVAKTPSR